MKLKLDKIIILLILTLGYTPVRVAAFPLNIVEDTASAIARFHCQLFYFNATPHETFSYRTLTQLANPSTVILPVHPDQIDTLSRYLGPHADMSFILGNHWQVLTREERRQFNQHFSTMLYQRYPLLSPNELQRQTCTGDQPRYFQRDEAGETVEIEPDALDKKRPVKALIQLELPGTHSPITLNYTLRKIPTERWMIEELQVNNLRLVETWRIPLGRLLVATGVTKMLESLVAESLPQP